MLLCRFQRSLQCLSPERNEVYVNSLKQNDLPQSAEKHSCITAPPDPPLPFSLPGFLGQQQHPVCRVRVSSSPRLVQSPPERPFPTIPTAQRPSSPWLRQRASSAAESAPEWSPWNADEDAERPMGDIIPSAGAPSNALLGQLPTAGRQSPFPKGCSAPESTAVPGLQPMGWEHCALLAVPALLAAPAAVRGVSDFQFLPHLSGYPRKGGRAFGAFRSFERSAAKAKRPQGLGMCEYIHCVDKEMIKSSIFRNQFAYVNTET